MKRPIEVALWHKTLKDSATGLKRKGDSGHPCQSPRFIENWGVGDPLIITEIEAEDINWKIQPRHFWQKSIRYIT